MNNSIELVSVQELLGEKFFIPSYQRGYRWTSQLVKDLLNDINEFGEKHNWNNTSAYYCVQPLVVNMNNDKWDVIDGQQRLTTVHLVLSYLYNSVNSDIDRNLFTIEYQTRKVSEQDKELGKEKGSKEFLEGISKVSKEESKKNVDFYHMFQAYLAIKEWFEGYKNEDGTFIESVCRDRDKFLKTLKANVKFIWYETKEPDPILVFARLNIGKISLTDSELVKALFLNRSNFTDNSRIRLIQQEIAGEWDKIESALQKDEIWLFLNEDVKWDKPTRIDFILSLIADKERDGLGLKGDLINDDEWENAWNRKGCFGDDEHQTFRYFYKYFTAKKDEIENEGVLGIWQKIKGFFQVFEEWYNDIELYHYIGFILHIAPTKYTPENLFDEWKETKDKNLFKHNLKEKIKGTLGNKNLNHQYSDNTKTECRPILLLHNVQTMLNNNISLKDSERYQGHLGIRFPFHLFKKEAHKTVQRYGWEVEHIASNAGDSNDVKDMLLFLFTAKDSIDSSTQKGEDIIQKIDNFRMNPNPENFSGIKNDILNYYKFQNHEDKEDYWLDNDTNKNKIWNFTLLDSGTNQQYQNSVYPFKRISIISKEQGRKSVFKVNQHRNTKEWSIEINKDTKDIAFVPICTKNVFVKAYSNIPKSLSAWTMDDAKDYLRNIEQILMEFIYPNLYQIEEETREILKDKILCHIDFANGVLPCDADEDKWRQYIDKLNKENNK